MAEKQVAQGVFNSQERDEKGRTATQRGSLKQVNATLLAQTEVLRDTQTSILSTNNLLTKSLEGQLRAASMAKLKDLEKDREGGRFKAVAGGIGAAGAKVVDAAKGGIGSLQGMLGKLGGFLTPAALAALPGILAGTLLKRGIPALAVGIFADEIAGFLLGPEASEEMKTQVTRAIQGGALGSLLGKKFALIGAAAGFLIDEEVAAQLLEVGKSFGNLLGADIANLDDLKGLMLSIGTFLRENLKAGLDGINTLLNGNLKEFFGIGEGENKVFSTLGLIAGLGLVLSPGATLGAMGFLGKKTLGLGLKALTVLWSGVPAVLRGLGLLGTAITASGASGATGAAGPAAAGSRIAMNLGKFGTFMTIGAGGGILLAATAGYAFTEWFKTTPLGQELMAMGEAASEKLNVGVEGQEKKELAETSVTDSELGIVTRDIGRDEQNNALRQTYIRAMENSEPGSDIYELNKKALAKLEAKMVDPGLARAVRTTTSENLKTNAMPNNAPPGQPMIIDGSNNTTNNIGQSNTTLSVPPPSAGQRDDYSRALSSRDLAWDMG